MNDELTIHAMMFAAHRHRFQRSKNSDHTPYINHPLEVMAILRLTGGVTDPEILSAALLHDTVEDTETTMAEIADHFGPVVASLVAEVTDDKSLPKARRKQLQIDHAPASSHGAKLVKLADKIANIGNMVAFPPATWPETRIIAYLDWAELVVAGLRGVNPAMEEVFDHAMTRARVRYGG